MLDPVNWMIEIPADQPVASGIEVELEVRLTTPLDGPGISTPKVQMLVGLGGNFVPLNGATGTTMNTSSMSSTQHQKIIHASLMCFPQGRSETLTFSPVVAGIRAGLWLAVRVGSVDESPGDSRRAALGLTGGAKILSFEITDPDADLERISLRASSHGEKPNSTTHAYIFPESFGAVQTAVDQGGCVNPLQALSALRGSASLFQYQDFSEVALHVSFRQKAEVTLGSASLPKRKVGRWFVLVVCEHPDLSHGDSCPDTDVTLSTFSESGAYAGLIKGSLVLMVLIVSFLVVVDSVYFLAHRWLISWDKSRDVGRRVWPAMPSLHFEVCRKTARLVLGRFLEPRTRFDSLLALMLGVFIATALQFALLRYWLMRISGNRDICFYNEKCYYPSSGVEMPVNNMISHIGYFLAGLHIFAQSLYAKAHCDGYIKNEASAAEQRINLSPFFAVAYSFCAEGIGSMCYHLCPAIDTFQFDTCFMIPIAHMCTITLIDWNQLSRVEQARSALKYFLFILVPIWLFNFIGTWFDTNLWQQLLASEPYWTYYILWITAIIIWMLVSVTAALDRCFEEDKKWDIILRRGLKGYIFVILALSSWPTARADIGGTANTFLTLSILVMAVVNLRHIWKLEFKRTWSARSFVGEIVIKFFYVVVLGFTSSLALRCFALKVSDVSSTGTPASSHDANSDMHDMWHTLSALGLALHGMFLLDVKVYSWARQEKAAVGLDDAISIASASTSNSDFSGHDSESATEDEK
eukprot:TRINITY_DN20421_c0_g1_i8.p1 TRINITY_DN20421_c0_g1~~TRINITY_DN20421_c0_g1_i8.p1  ORF type:complete len:825 (+),score=115.26 TRINITY_DN20421_c0_g1_i8:222-2477(+)